jgi:phosphinothricin acetyltransferase
VPTVRAAKPEDAPRIAAIYRPIVERTAISFEDKAPSQSEMAQRIETTLRTYPWLVAEETGSILGYAYAAQHRAPAAYRWSVNVSIYIANHAHRQGVGRALYETLFETLRHQGIRNVFAGIALPNVASVGLHESCGFAPIGVYREVGFKFGRWHDVGWWQKTIGDTAAEPPSFMSFAELARWNSAAPRS